MIPEMTKQIPSEVTSSSFNWVFWCERLPGVVDFDETKKPTLEEKIVVIFPFSVSALCNQVQILFNGDN